MRIEARIAEHRHVHEIAVFQDDLVRRRAHGAVRLHRVLAVDVIDQVRAVVPEAGHIHMARAARNRQPVGWDRQPTLAARILAQTEAVALERGDEQVQHRRLFDELAVFVVVVRLQTVLREIKIRHLQWHVGKHGIARAGLERVVVGQGEQDLHGLEVLAVGVGVVLVDGKRDRRFANAIPEGNCLCADKLRVKRVKLLYILQTQLHACVIAPIRRKLDARQVKLFALFIGRFIAAGDFEPVENRLSAVYGAICSLRPVLPAGIRSVQQTYSRSVFELVCCFLCSQLVRVRSERIIGTIQI